MRTLGCQTWPDLSREALPATHASKLKTSFAQVLSLVRPCIDIRGFRFAAHRRRVLQLFRLRACLFLGQCAHGRTCGGSRIATHWPH
jgi:DNA-binding FadR family transcriptional regulator